MEGRWWGRFSSSATGGRRQRPAGDPVRRSPGRRDVPLRGRRQGPLVRPPSPARPAGHRHRGRRAGRAADRDEVGRYLWDRVMQHRVQALPCRSGSAAVDPASAAAAASERRRPDGGHQPWLESAPSITAARAAAGSRPAAVRASSAKNSEASNSPSRSTVSVVGLVSSPEAGGLHRTRCDRGTASVRGAVATGRGSPTPAGSGCAARGEQRLGGLLADVARSGERGRQLLDVPAVRPRRAGCTPAGPGFAVGRCCRPSLSVAVDSIRGQVGDPAARYEGGTES